MTTFNRLFFVFVLAFTVCSAVYATYGLSVGDATAVFVGACSTATGTISALTVWRDRG